MRCTTVREALSARLDGEEVGLAVHDLDAHVAGCVDCQAWSRSAGALAQIVARAPRDHVALDPAVLASPTSPASESRTGLLATSEWRITSFGRLLVLKVALVAGMLVAAAVSRSWVRQRVAARTAALALSPGPGAVAASPD